MIDRFLRYSLEHGRKIAVIIQREGAISRTNITVTHLAEGEIRYTTARSAREKTLPREHILSAAYARGDDGDTLRHEREADKK